MTPSDFEHKLLSLLEGWIAQEGLRRLDASHERAFSTVSVGTEHAGVRFLLEWRELHVQVKFFRCMQGRPPLLSPAEPSPDWLGLEEWAEVSGLHSLEQPRLTASALTDEGLAQVTPGDVWAYLGDVVPLLQRAATPWLRGQLESFEAAIRARQELLREPELSEVGTSWLILEEEGDADIHAPAFVGGLVRACAPLTRAGWSEVRYAAAPRALALALAHPLRQVGVEVRLRWPPPPEAHVELLWLVEGRPPPYGRLDRRVALRWALEAAGVAVPRLDRGAGLGLQAFVGEAMAALAQASPAFLAGDTAVLHAGQTLRQQMEDSLGAEFR